MSTPQTRGEVLKLHGVGLTPDRTPVRNDDGSHPFSPRCGECGAARLRVEWNPARDADGKPIKGIGGTIRHVHDDESPGCSIDVQAFVAERAVAEPKPAAPVAAAPEPVAPAWVPKSDEDLVSVMFAYPIDMPIMLSGGHSTNGASWTRQKHAATIGCVVGKGYVHLATRDAVWDVPMHNVTSIKRKVKHGD